jgi:glycosyltransferase involved in cell wall biosynthesis
VRIVHISTEDHSGGASIAAFRLHSAMLKNGIDSKMLVKTKTLSSDKNILCINQSITFRFKRKFAYKVLGKNTKHDTKKGIFSFPFVGIDVSMHPSLQLADIIFLHWINRDFLRVTDIKKILMLNKPVFWVLHDMWPMTGGCHHSFECKKYESSCTYCPLLKNPASNDLSHKLFDSKIFSFIPFNNLNLIAPSKWISESAKKSRLFSGKRIIHIPNYIDTQVFAPTNKKAARELFGIKVHEKVIMFGATEGTDNPYKGWPYLLESLNILSKENSEYKIIILGSEKNDSFIQSVPFPVIFSGHINSEERICNLYNSADVFVAPSLADNLPNMVIESLACETPVVGFNIGGIPDLIIHKENGYIANYMDSYDLLQGIKWVFDNKNKLQPATRSKIVYMMDGVLKNILSIMKSI